MIYALNWQPFGGKILQIYPKRVKARKQGHLPIGGAFYLLQYDWLKGSHMTKVKVLCLPHETDYSYSCEFVVPNTPYAITHNLYHQR